MSIPLKHSLSVARRELLSMIVSPVAYGVVAGFLLLTGYFFFNLLGTYNLKLAQYAALPVKDGSTVPSLQEWVIEPYFQILIFLLLFALPFLTMRIFAEEKRQGTFDLLSVSPLSSTSLVLGKYVAVVLLSFVMCCGSFTFPVFLWFHSSLEISLLLSGSLGVLFSALLFCVIGIVFSTLTDRQVLAGGASLCFSLMLYFSHSFSDSVSTTLAPLFVRLSPVTQTEDLIRGALSLSNLVYFASFILFGLFACISFVSFQRER